MNRALLSPASVLAAHLESVVSERRVLVIGDAERSLAEQLLERGARLVQVLDPDPRRVAHCAAHNRERRVTYAQLTDSALRDGSFDCAIVEDIALTDDLAQLVRGVARSLGTNGVAAFCASNPESSTGLLGATSGSVDYDTLCDVTEDEFETVLMLGQSPFLGYSVVQFDLDQPPEPSLDNAYLDGQGETPDFYVALCGTTETMQSLFVEEMSIVQLPAARFVEDSEQIHRQRELRAARRIESLERDLQETRSRRSDEEVERLTAELEQRDAWIHKLESRAETADARADDATSELEDLETELETTHELLIKERSAYEKEISKLTTTLERAKASEQQVAKLTKELEDAKSSEKQVNKLTKELEHAKSSASEAKHHSAGREALEEEVTKLDESKKRLEKELKDKSRALEKLERRLAEAEKEIDDLHDQLDETEDMLLKAKQETAGPTLSEVERDVRGLEDQLKHRGERITELESQLKKLETYAKTLAAELSATDTGGGSRQTQIEELSRALAEREADLVAAEWKIGQLKHNALKG